jgi:hypothetical protein
MSLDENSTVRRLSVEEVAPRIRRVPERTEPPPVPVPTVKSDSSTTLDVVVTAFGGLAYALSARALLLLSLIGSFVLAFEAMRSQTLASLEILVAYSALTVLPVTYLEIRKRL